MLSAAVLALSGSSAFVLPAAARPVVQARTASPVALLDALPLQLLADIVDAGGERIYGAVDAPSWVAPVGGIAVISTALLPV